MYNGYILRNPKKVSLREIAEFHLKTISEIQIKLQRGILLIEEAKEMEKTLQNIGNFFRNYRVNIPVRTEVAKLAHRIQVILILSNSKLKTAEQRRSAQIKDGKIILQSHDQKKSVILQKENKTLPIQKFAHPPQSRDVLSLIFLFLLHQDLISCKAVCLSWSSAANATILQERLITIPYQNAILLLANLSRPPTLGALNQAMNHSLNSTLNKIMFWKAKPDKLSEGFQKLAALKPPQQKSSRSS